MDPQQNGAHNALHSAIVTTVIRAYALPEDCFDELMGALERGITGPALDAYALAILDRLVTDANL